jgi:hypothetical protein|mmetsp:Transcript_23554/g.31589  ORF Transcript_23554/g.31589 Transcript_23554/m.31589 type:complete len:107 (-) Transcript_23554:109-429(-)
MMNGVMKRMQEFPKHWRLGLHRSKLVPLENIKQVPIAMFIASEDTSCLPSVAQEHIPRIGSEVTVIDVEGAGHEYFKTVSNSDWFMEKLVEQLQVPIETDPLNFAQ